MKGASWLAACCLVAAALVVGLPERPRARRRFARLSKGDPQVAGRRLMLRRAGWRPPSWALVLTCGCAIVSAVSATAGPVAGLAAGAYSAIAARVLRRRRADQEANRQRVLALDTLYCLAADLRAGAPAGEMFNLEGCGRLAWLAGTLRQVADQTGAPLADLLERVAADARATDRISALATAQAAGARATACLLAALPGAGVALGYTIGADPLRVLLHTHLGAGCAAVAIALQLAGLEWSDRIIRPARSSGGAPP